MRIRILRNCCSLTLAFLLLAACGGYDAKVRGLEKYVGSHRIGNEPGKSPDQWLELKNLAGDWEKVALIFAYSDDYEGCTEIAKQLNAAWNREHRCIPAN